MIKIALFCLFALILQSTASPTDEKWLARNKLTMHALETSNDQAIDSNLREALNQWLSQLNQNRPKLTNTASRSVQSFYPKCELNGENKHGKEGLSIYYDLQHSSINANTIFGSNLRVYLKKTNNCECKLNADQLIQLSLYDAPSKVTFTPFTVSKKQPIQTIRFNRCCEQKITFNLIELVQRWKLYPKSNHGLLLELADNLGNKLNVDDYIQSMDCADKSLPFPYVKMLYPDLPDLVQQHVLFYPTLDVAFDRTDALKRKSTQQVLEDDRPDKDA